MIRTLATMAMGCWLALVPLGGRDVRAQEQPAVQKPQEAAATKPAPVSPDPKLTPLRLQLVLSRFVGDKKISSLPYVLWVTANDPRTTNLRMGVEVPISTVRGPVAASGFTYRSVGTNIDCRATSLPDGSYNLSITVEDSSILFDSKNPADAVLPAAQAADAPAFRQFKAAFFILLRDGQTAQYTSATDPVSGEILRVDVTLNVLK